MNIMNIITGIQIGPHELSGKTVLVTGGTKGMGEAIVKRLRQAGATVITTARSIPDNLQSPELFIQSDISTPGGVQTVVREVLARFGGLDILINNVGGSSAPSGGALALSDDDWQQAVNDNLFSAVRLDRAFLPKMLEQHSGVIIHISSIQRTLPLHEATLAYAAAKAALTIAKDFQARLHPTGCVLTLLRRISSRRGRLRDSSSDWRRRPVPTLIRLGKG